MPDVVEQRGDANELAFVAADLGEVLMLLEQRERPPREVTRRTIERREIDRIPGTSGDALRSLQSLPGVARPPGLAGFLIVRGSAPTVNGKRLDPVNEYGHDVLWWLDRMVRSQRPLVEKMTLFWHDHFATADQDTPLMLGQNHTLRRGGLGSFRTLLGAVTRDPAMQLFLSLADSDKRAPNENYARELMELFTLGSGYTERDIREVVPRVAVLVHRAPGEHRDLVDRTQHAERPAPLLVSGKTVRDLRPRPAGLGRPLTGAPRDGLLRF